MIGVRSAAVASGRDRGSDVRHRESPPPSHDIPELQSNGSTSSDDDAQGTSHKKGKKYSNGSLSRTSAGMARKMSVADANTALYLSPARNHYHKKILDRMGLKSMDDLGLGSRGSDKSSEQTDDRGSLMGPSHSFAMVEAFVYPPAEEEVRLRDRIYGLFTNFEDLGLQYNVDAKWKRANFVIVRVTSLVVALSILSLCFETVYKFRSAANPLFSVIEAVCVSWLLIDFIARVTCTRDDVLTLLSDPMTTIDFVSMLPIFVDLMVNPDVSGLAVIRVVRLVRTVRLIRNSRTQGILELFRAMRKSIAALSLLFFLLLIALFVSSSVIYLLDIQDATFDNGMNQWIRSDGTISPFQSVFHCMWFGINTLTTAGYGDGVPFAPSAKAASAVLMVTGILVIAFPTVILSASFHQAYSERFLTLLRNNLTDKQRESLAFGRNRRSIAALASTRRPSLSFGTAGGADAPKRSFKGRLLSILQRHGMTEEEQVAASQQQEQTPAQQGDAAGGNSEAASQQQGKAPSSATPDGGRGVERTDSKSSVARTGSSKWAALRAIAQSGDSSDPTPKEEGDNGTGGGAVGGSKPVGRKKSMVTLLPKDEERAAPQRTAVSPPRSKPKPTLTITTTTPKETEENGGDGGDGMDTIQDLEKRFAPPEIGPVKIAYVPFLSVSSGSFNDDGEGRNSNATAPSGSAHDDDDDGWDTRGVVRQPKRYSNRRQSMITTSSTARLSSSRALRLAARKATATANLGNDGVELCSSDSANEESSSSASASSSLSHDDDKEAVDAGSKPASEMCGLTRNAEGTQSAKAFQRRSRAPTIVMASKSAATTGKPFKKESNMFRRVDMSLEYLNYNMQQLKSQMMGPGGIVLYPPKLKLLCIGGTSTITVKADRCFPPGSHSLTFTVVLDDAEYHRLQTRLAMLTFGADKVRGVEVAPIYKLRVDIRMGNLRMFAAMQRTANGLKPLGVKASNDPSLIDELMPPADRELLDSCYLTTTTYRDIASATIDAVVMCPCASSCKALQRYLHLLKFSFDVQFRKPQHGKVLVQPRHTTNISLCAPQGLADVLRKCPEQCSNNGDAVTPHRRARMFTTATVVSSDDANATSDNTDTGDSSATAGTRGHRRDPAARRDVTNPLSPAFDAVEGGQPFDAGLDATPPPVGEHPHNMMLFAPRVSTVSTPSGDQVVELLGRHPSNLSQMDSRGSTTHPQTRIAVGSVETLTLTNA